MTGTIDPALFGMPNASNTGVPAGTTLTAYTGPMTITTPGTVIDGMIIDGTLTVAAENVTIKNCVIQNYGFWGVDASAAVAIGNVTVQNCTLTASSSYDTDSAIVGSGTFIGNNISNSENGFRLLDGASVVKGNYIHDLNDNFGDPHYDGIALQGGQNNVQVERNTVIGRDTSDIFIKNDFGPISNVTVTDNLLLGDPKYGVPASDVYVYGPDTTNVTVSNNYMQKPYWDYVAVSNANPTISGNVEWDNSTDPTPYPSSVPTTPSTPTATSSSLSTPTTAASSTDSGAAGDNTTSYSVTADTAGSHTPYRPSDLTTFNPAAVSGLAGTDGRSIFQISDLWSHASATQQVDTTGHVETILGMSRSFMLTGTTDHDVTVGNGGADTFAFTANFGRGILNDFVAGAPAQNTLQFSNSAFDNFASVLSRAALSGHDLGIATGNDTPALHDTKLDMLKNLDFRFA
ncbi:Right handed beta helix region [Bradyrhizobium sp. Rc2d]|uniref:right-handed parallel beta-helix repeat-containing protein n=1 Tax=Bradyrhizobium sp. Rc2d TaxID=1855321 RepID=UPI000881639B|nr:right-handed parallel beta-helix repeat-containing protein [Bradyrhizobium sp. Rc2d]SDG37903.1 Right handed beta helix region [Bradyrhizobium sp. Rc2d]